MSRSANLSAARALALLRITAGLVCILGAAHKMRFFVVLGFLPLPVTTLSWQLDLPIQLSSWLAMHPGGILARIVRDLLLPKGALVAGLLSWVELLAGGLLLVGLRTRLAALLAAIVSGALVLAAGGVGSIGARPYLLLLVVLLALVIGDAGQVAGLDGWRSERRRDLNL